VPLPSLALEAVVGGCCLAGGVGGRLLGTEDLRGRLGADRCEPCVVARGELPGALERPQRLREERPDAFDRVFPTRPPGPRVVRRARRQATPPGFGAVGVRAVEARAATTRAPDDGDLAALEGTGRAPSPISRHTETVPRNEYRFSDTSRPDLAARPQTRNGSSARGPRPTGEDVEVATPEEVIDVIVEIPAGSRNKYEYDHERHLIRLDRRLGTAMTYPADYGFVPETLALDGDPLDALVLLDDPTFPGCLVRVRVIGVFQMKDEAGPDAKLLTVLEHDPMRTDTHDVSDLPSHFLDEIAHFFSAYKALEPGKSTQTIGFEGRDAALEELRASRDRFRAAHRS
jgi:inorganic pyrophosphatase